MRLPETQKKASGLSEEYAVYIYRKVPQRACGQVDWERKIITKSRRRALMKAKRLFASNDFHKVEVKRKVVAPSGTGALDLTVKRYEKKTWASLPVGKKPLVAGLVFASTTIAALLYFLFLF